MDPQAHNQPVEPMQQTQAHVSSFQEPKRKSKAPLFLFLLFLMFLLCGGAAVGGYLYGKDDCECPKCEDTDTGSDTDDMYSCSSDEDCIVVQDGCCACTEDGKNTSINKNFDDSWDDEIAKDCEVSSGCAEVESDDWTCGERVEASCVEGKCKLEEGDIDREWKTVDIIGFEAQIPSDWDVEDTSLPDDSVRSVVLTDNEGEKYYVSSLCQLGDCGICEYAKNERVFFEIDIFEVKNTVNIVDCTDDMGTEEIGKSLSAVLEDAFEDSPNLYFGYFMKDTESTDEELLQKYKDLKLILESFEFYSE